MNGVDFAVQQSANEKLQAYNQPVKKEVKEQRTDTNAKVKETVKQGGEDQFASDKSGKAASEQQIFKAVEEANKKLEVLNKQFEFSIHEGTKKIMVRVKNADTDELIREIPSEKILNMVANMCEMAGIFLDEKG